MKPLELTSRHRKHLLEMCEVLFPEYKWDVEHGCGQYVHYISKDKGKPILLDGWLYEGQKHKVDECIHWFEFCLTHLQQKLCKLLQEPIDSWNNKLSRSITKSFKIGKTYFYSQTGNNYIIDYLYSEFKKLK